METMSRSVLSPAPVRFGRNALPRCSRPWSAPPLLGGRGKHQTAVIPLLLQVRAKAPSSEKQTSLSFPVHETEGVRSLYEEIRDKVVSMRLVAAGVSIAAAFLVAFSDVDPASARSAGDVDLPPIEPAVATVSSSKEINLAKQLKAIGAKMYGAFWCSHCFEQKQMFGKEAMKYIEYVECYPEGYRRGVKLAAACSAANIQGFPTWVINGQHYSGEQEFDKLAALSGFSVQK